MWPSIYTPWLVFNWIVRICEADFSRKKFDILLQPYFKKHALARFASLSNGWHNLLPSLGKGYQ
jgi:hypothetical protein